MKTATRKGKKPKSTRRAAKVLLVNLIPKSLSDETNQDSEPSIAVNPANPQIIAAGAFTPDPSNGKFAPIYISKDGGNTWVLNSIIPGANADTGTGDITVSFGKGNTLYSAILRGDDEETTRMNILRTTLYASGEPMKVLVNRGGAGVDQPWVRAATSGQGSKSKDYIFIGSNDFNVSDGNTATIDASLDAGVTKPKFWKVRIEARQTSGQDGPTVRPVIHADGTLYAVFHAWRTYNEHTGLGTADVVVVRDDNGGTGSKRFADLVDSDGNTGMRVVHGVRFNFDGYLGQQRTGGDVALAADPTNSHDVYVAYNDDQGSDYNLHVRASTDRGATWSSDIHTVPNALNGALAVNDEGTLGFLYQQLTGSKSSSRWITRLELRPRNSTKWKVITLATTPANTPEITFDPYLGDYDQMVAVGRDFCGVFSANNTPRKANFPSGVTYQRNANFTKGTLLGLDNSTEVHVSIDPFFFKVSP